MMSEYELDLSEPPSATRDSREGYSRTRAGAPMLLDAPEGRSVAQGILTGFAPLSPGEQLWKRAVETVTTADAQKTITGD